MVLRPRRWSSVTVSGRKAEGRDGERREPRGGFSRRDDAVVKFPARDRTGHREGGARRIGEARADGQAETRQAADEIGDERRFATEKMGDARDLDADAVAARRSPPRSARRALLFRGSPVAGRSSTTRTP